MLVSDREELAWAAGFHDGEGHVGLLKQGGALVLHVGQTEPATLERFRRAVGGLGKVTGPYGRKNPKHTPMYYFREARFEAVQAIVAMLWEFLSPVKQKQISIAFRAYHQDEHRPTRRKQWGWPVHAGE